MSDATSISSLPAPVSDNQQQQVQQINQNNIKYKSLYIILLTPLDPKYVYRSEC